MSAHQPIFDPKKPLSGRSACVAVPPKPSSSPSQPPSHHSSPTEHQRQTAAAGPWSPALEAVLESPSSRLPRWFLLCGLLFSVTLGIWTWVGHFNEVVQAQGRLVPQGDTHKVHPVEPGQLISLQVKEGQTVQEGDLLATLANDEAREEAERLQHSILLKQQQLLQQRMLLDTAHRERQAHRLIADSEQQQQQVELAQARLEAETLQGVLERDRQGLKLQEQRVQRLIPLVEAGAIAKERIFQAEQNIYQQKTELFQAEASLIQAEAEIQQLQSIQVQKQREAQNRQLQSEQQITELTQQTLQLREQLNNAESQLQQIQRQLQDYALYAPISGIIASLNVQNPGEMISAGQTLLEIRQKDDPLVLEAAIASQDAGFIELGTEAKLRFDAYPYQKFGVIPGQIVFTSPDSYEDAHIGPAYRLKIKTEKAHISAGSEIVQLQAGQTATADIVIRRRRIADLLLEPFSKLNAKTFGAHAEE